MRPGILVLHGITMSGRSMLQLLGPIRDGLEAAGFDLIAPDAVPMRPETLAKFPGFDVYWQGGGGHHHWFDAETDPTSGTKTYTAVAEGMQHIRDATAGRDVVGVLGFSQGCAMAGLVTGLAERGQLPLELRFGLYLSGFKPVFDEPALEAWPVRETPGLFVWGTADPVFSEVGRIDELAAEFAQAERIIVDGLGHLPPTDPALVQRLVSFAVEHGGA